MLDERLFRDALVRERKRADRSGQSFLVLLVDRGHSPLDWDAWTAALSAVAATSRGIDLVGWLEQGTVLAVILPDLPATAVPSKVESRMRRELAARLDPGVLAGLSIRLYAHAGPSWGNGAGLASVDLLLEAFAEGDGLRLRDGAKRALDIVGSLALLLLFSPLFAAAAALVKATSPGPVLFRQVRVGRRGRPFTMLKFRTMYWDAGQQLHQDYVDWFIKSSSRQPRNGNEVFKLTNDPRVTRVGRFLRKSSVDELPQFWNVLRGEMSLVGPRPPLPFEVKRYQPWHWRRVLEVKPGVTGLWQVSGRSRTTFDEMVRLDLRYARTYSLWTDIKILAATPRAVISGTGAG